MSPCGAAVRRSVIAVLIAAMLALSAPLTALAQDAADAPSTRWWTQRRGNADRSGSVDVEPLRAAPVTVWRVEFEHDLASRPVIWGGHIYIVVGSGRHRRLRALRLETGAEVASATLKGSGPVELVTHRGIVVAREAAGVTAFRHRGARFQKAWHVASEYEDAYDGAPCVAWGSVWLPMDGSVTRRFDVQTGERLDTRFQSEALLSVCTSHDDRLTLGATIGTHPRQRGIFLYLELRGLDNELARTVFALRGDDTPICEVASYDDSEDDASFTAVQLATGRRRSWLVTSLCDFEGKSGVASPGVLVMPDGSVVLSPIATPPAVHRGVAFGFTRAGDLVAVDATGAQRTLLTSDNRPRGALPSAPTLARGVLLFRNWAADIESGRVLWVAPDLDVAESLIPAGDHRAIGFTSAALIGLADVSIVEAELLQSTAVVERREVPQDVPGVLRLDGTFVPGTWAFVDGGDVEVSAPDGGVPARVSREHLACAGGGETDTTCDDPMRVVDAWRRIVDSHAQHAFVGLFRRLARERLLADARRTLAIAGAHGLPVETSDALEVLLAGKRPLKDPAARAPRVQRNEAKERAALVTTYLSGVAWCRERELDGAASCLLALAADVAPDDAETHRKLHALETALRPSGFDVARAPGAWMRWARELVPSGATPVSPSDPGRERATGIWREGTMVFRTRNVLFFSRVNDPETVGRCLRQAEGTVRALERLFPHRASEALDSQLLDVRLHRSRADYLAEGTGGASWSAGYYSPRDGVSRFFVKSAVDAAEPLGRGLFSTLAHEVTHHWIHRRLIGDQSSVATTPGYWVVEGIAQFVGDQAVEMGRRSDRLDDPTVPSIDAAAQVARGGKLIPMARLLAMPRLGFAGLDDDSIVTVDLRNNLGALRLSERSVFYEQAGALAFFLANRGGADGRRRFFEYLVAHYRGASHAEVWRELGFVSVEDLEARFVAWLHELTR